MTAASPLCTGRPTWPTTTATWRSTSTCWCVCGVCGVCHALCAARVHSLCRSLAERGRRPLHPLQRFRSLPGPGPPQPHPHVRGRAGGAWAWTALYSMSWADCSLLRCATGCGRWRRSTRTCPRCVHGQLADGRGVLSAPPSQMPEPHEDFGCWWTIYDYGLDTVKTWKKGCVTAAVRLRASMLAVLTVPPFAQLQAPLPRGAVAQARGGRLLRRQGGPPRPPRRQSERRCGAFLPLPPLPSAVL
jgi:hypothetical protein